MPIVSPQLDDIVYDRTVEELKRRIPVYAPEWTNFNDSDPGITLIQLFAYLAEQIGYRLNQIPEKNYIELLKLLGIELAPAHAARTALALLLSNPSTLVGYTLDAGARANATKGSPPPVYETDVAIDVVPAESVLFLTTRNPYLYDVLLTDSGRDPAPNPPPKLPANDTEWLSVVWDGKTPKLADMPLDPVSMKRSAHPYFWIGLDLNAALNAGFRGVRVTLTIQFDDDEQPDLTKDQTCAAAVPPGESPPVVDWLAYYDTVAEDLIPVQGRIDDTTAHLTKSGTIAFTVPLTIGPIADSNWINMQDPGTVTPLDACIALGTGMQTTLQGLGQPLNLLDRQTYQTVINAGVTALDSAAGNVLPLIPHPLDPTLRAGVKGWIRLGLPALASGTRRPKIRIVSFNAVPVTQAVTETNELLGKGDGRPGQTFTLANGNVLADTLSVAMQEDIDPTTPLVPWSLVDTLDTAGPLDSVYELDAEAGVITFGDGINGRIPPLVPGTGDIVALKYRHGGGLAGEVPVGAITALATAVPGVAQVVNFVAATGGRDAETLDHAKLRARKLLSSRDRAVTAGDFEWIALQTPNVRVARVAVIPLRRPLASSSTAPTPPSPPRCGPALPTGPAGLDPRTAAGAVTVVAVPDDTSAEPIPTPSFLRAVCQQLDVHRLVTTEVHVIPPQYCRICQVLVTVVPKPGYTRSAIQKGVEDRLGTYLHVLRGGADGTGFPFGGQVHIADLMAQVFRVDGVDRVESMSTQFTRTKSNASPREGQLVLCPAGATQMDKVNLGPEENVSIDVTSIAVTTTGA